MKKAFYMMAAAAIALSSSLLRRPQMLQRALQFLFVLRLA